MVPNGRLGNGHKILAPQVSRTVFLPWLQFSIAEWSLQSYEMVAHWLATESTKIVWERAKKKRWKLPHKTKSKFGLGAKTKISVQGMVWTWFSFLQCGSDRLCYTISVWNNWWKVQVMLWNKINVQWIPLANYLNRAIWKGLCHGSPVHFV